MKFVIRDDDLNYFSKPADIERWYADIFAQKIPVGFATIPFVKPESDVYTAGTTFENKEYPINENSELTAFVKNSLQIEILQHGTTHETKEGVFEYAGSVAGGETKRGRKELEKAFGTKVAIFVPPHDWIGTDGIRAVEAANMNIIRGRGAGLKNLIFNRHYFLIFIRMLFFKLSHALRGKVPAYPYVLDFGKHKEVCSYRLEDTDLFHGLTYAHKKNGIFVVVVHLHFFTEEKKQRLHEVIAQAQLLSAEFVRPSELFHD